MVSVVLLVQKSEYLEDGNYLRIANCLMNRGVSVSLCLSKTISMAASKIIAQGFVCGQMLKANAIFPRIAAIDLSKADMVWVLSLGMRDSFLDTLQLLHCLETDTRVINSTNALMHLKSKYYLARHGSTFKYPDSFGSSNAEYLLNVVSKQGGDWIAKPPAGSLGRQVFKLNARDPNCKVILETITGPEQNQFCLLQPYIEDISLGEKRVLIAAGAPVGQYLRQAETDHRTNIAAGATYQSCTLTPAEMAYCRQIGKFLLAEGASFVGLDLAYPYVVECNVINPGGLVTIESVSGEDLTGRVIDNIFPDSRPGA